MLWKAFLPWLEKKYPNEVHAIQALLAQVCELVQDLSHPKITKILEGQIFQEAKEIWDQFIDHIRHGNGELSFFWMSYVDMVDLFLGLLRASREGD